MSPPVARASHSFGAIALIAALAAALPSAAAASPAPTHRSAARSCWAGYSYDGVQSPTRAFGVSGQITLDQRSSVSAGHVAAWIGVGGAGLGPGGSDEWVQAGIAHDAGGQDLLYYEFKRPGDASPTYVTLGVAQPAVPHSFVVYERASQRDAWRVMLDGQKVSGPIVLPGSHGAFQPVATAENWDGGVAGTCNRYAFDFSSLAVESQYGSGWQAFDLSRVLRDPAYALSLRASGFTATSR
jgi:hypothetical protein